MSTLEELFENLQRHFNVVATLDEITSQIQEQAPFAKSFVNSILIEEYQLFQVFFDDIIWFAQNMKTQNKNIENKTSSRLQWIKEIFFYSELYYLTPSQMDIVWNCFITNKEATNGQIQIAFNFLSECILSSDKQFRSALMEKNRLKGITIKILSNMFKTFATKQDGKMCMNDMKRYALSCGAGEHAITTNRWRSVFRMFDPDSNDDDAWSLEGYLRFYADAIRGRVDVVWNDLNIYGCRYDTKNGVSHKDILPRFVITTNDKYFHVLFNKILQKKLNVNDNDYDPASIQRIAWNLIANCPINPKMKKKIFDLDECISMNELFHCDNFYVICYNVLICKAIIDDDDDKKSILWKKKFVERKGINYLLKMLCVLFEDEMMRNREKAKRYCLNTGLETKTHLKEPAYNLAFANLLVIIHSFFIKDSIPLYIWMNRIIKRLNSFTFQQLNCIKNINKNMLVHFIILCSKMNINHDSIHFAQLFSMQILQKYIEPLIYGFVSQSHLNVDIPLDIMSLLSLLFL